LRYFYFVNDEDRKNEERDRRDIEIINRHTECLNREAMDSLGYQQIPRSARTEVTTAPLTRGGSATK
jgi:hypothetical protein